jgi:hypothetical protein
MVGLVERAPEDDRYRHLDHARRRSIVREAAAPL